MHLAVMWFFTDEPTGGRQTDRHTHTDRENREACGPFKVGGNYNVEGRENRTAQFALTQKSNQKFDGKREAHQAARSAVSRRDPNALKNEVREITFVPARISLPPRAVFGTAGSFST